MMRSRFREEECMSLALVASLVVLVLSALLAMLVTLAVHFWQRAELAELDPAGAVVLGSNTDALVLLSSGEGDACGWVRAQDLAPPLWVSGVMSPAPSRGGGEHVVVVGQREAGTMRTGCTDECDVRFAVFEPAEPFAPFNATLARSGGAWEASCAGEVFRSGEGWLKGGWTPPPAEGTVLPLRCAPLLLLACPALA